MALIRCSECGREISDKAATCPGCGAPITLSNERQPPSASPSWPTVLGFVAVGLGISGVLVPYFAAVFFLPAALICGIVAYIKGEKSLGIVAILLGVVGMIYVISLSQQIMNITRPSGSISLPQPAFAPPPVVTKAEYDRIIEGMTYETVRSIIGASGEEISRSDIAGYTTAMYQWSNANGSNMNAMFENNRLVSKAQFGLP